MGDGTSGHGRTGDGDSGADGEMRQDGEGTSGDSGDSASGDAASGDAASGDAAGDHIDQGLRAIIEGDAGAARFQEPSAKERNKLAKQRRQKQLDDDKKFAKLETETRRQAEKLAKKARKEQRRAVWRRGLRRTAWALSVVVVAGGCVFAYTRTGHSASGPGGVNDSRTVTNGALPPGTKPASPLTDSGPPADPFAGSPADKWAAGAAGIVVPAARPIGQYPASKVEYAYQTTKKLLVAAALDNQALNGGAPTAFANLLTQDQRTQFVSQLDKIGVDKHGDALSTRSWIVQFAPGTSKLIGSAIKVHGTMSAIAAKDSSGYPILRVKIDYLVVYAIEPPKEPADWMRIVGQFYGTADFGSWRDADTPFEPWWDAAPGMAGALCGTRDGFAHPAYPNGTPGSVAPSGVPVNPYSLAAPSGIGCHATTGT
ncbi:MAG TPA: hypothetical protein VF060_21330 [Trebonia sp.]